MSYEGYEEFLCENGHYSHMNCYLSDDYKKCNVCGAELAYYHPVDQTNGYEEDNPATYPAEKEEVGYDDKWHEDHYGNKYATKILKFKPIGNEWRPLNDSQ